MWNDVNKDGRQDAGEPGLPGVSVDLLDASGNIIATTTTDQNGAYTFPGLPPGVYSVKVSDTQNTLEDYSVGPVVLGSTVDGDSKLQPYQINLGANQTNATADFGYVRTGRTNESGIIGNQVWYETDGDGIYEPGQGDQGVEGVTVELLDVQSRVVMTTTTGASGDYVFTSLISGTYQVRVTDAVKVLDGYLVTRYPADQTSDNTNKRQPYTVTLPADGIRMIADFGYTRPSAIGDLVWYDTDGDGIEDVSEPGIANVTLTLWDAGPDGLRGTADDQPRGATTTNSSGGYIFEGLSPGNYWVDVTDLNGVLIGRQQIVGNQAQPDPTGIIALAGGQVYKDADFAYRQAPGPGKAIIGDTVFYDGNGDGIQQPNEPGIPGVTVSVTPAGGGAPILVVTDINGHYLVEVPAGTYTVTPLNPPAGFTPTTPTSRTVTVVANEQLLTVDFGYTSPSLGKIGDFLFDDANKNGVFDGADAPLPGVIVELILDVNNVGVWDGSDRVIATAFTDQNGIYQFTGAPAGNYLVHVSDVNAVLLDWIKSPLGTPNLNNNNQADPFRVTLEHRPGGGLCGLRLPPGESTGYRGHRRSGLAGTGQERRVRSAERRSGASWRHARAARFPGPTDGHDHHGRSRQI